MRNLRSVRAARLGVAALALALTATACGSDRSEEDGSQASAGGSSESAATSATAFGDLESPCGEGDAAGATDQGVTDDAITIGYGDDRGFAAAPGLNQEMGDAVKAMIAWCNEQGGINGREVVGNQYDAAMTNAASVVQKSCKQDFMLVGQGFAYDEAAEQFRVGCDLPTVAGFVIGPNSAMGPDKFEPVPLPVDRYNSAMLASAMEVYPELKEAATGLGSTSPAISQGVNKVLDAIGKLDGNVVDCGVTINQDGEANYVPFAEKLKDCDAKALWITNTPTPIAFGLLEALQRVDAGKKYVFESTWYGDVTSQWNAQSGAADGLLTGLVFQPMENADAVPAVQDYLDVVVDGAGAKPGLLGMQAVSAFLLWADVAKDCGSDLTRECMVEGLSGVHEWTGGGLHAPADPGANMPPSCALVVQLEGDTFEQVYPETKGEFNCDDSYVLETDPANSGVTLNEDRLSTAFLK
ncbi:MULTISPECIES: ABC transporter substrate-binding protein [unclassified Nocardioides]|uniref:ABC transporter substrate-binding protein n=1 Tax=unclassified Nocardioides TaxID=2615069 RepID=UPI0026653D33|nr:ABC transporter substrate-binding protein [Nocardioides sp. Arc9.136]WKN47004.1 ABC transporter substrate-binding protein [Nocardioides sp. Arc9.136]